jgi:hypothetical protein
MPFAVIAGSLSGTAFIIAFFFFNFNFRFCFWITYYGIEFVGDLATTN